MYFVYIPGIVYTLRILGEKKQSPPCWIKQTSEKSVFLSDIPSRLKYLGVVQFPFPRKKYRKPLAMTKQVPKEYRYEVPGITLTGNIGTTKAHPGDNLSIAPR